MTGQRTSRESILDKKDLDGLKALLHEFKYGSPEPDASSQPKSEAQLKAAKVVLAELKRKREASEENERHSGDEFDKAVTKLWWGLYLYVCTEHQEII